MAVSEGRGASTISIAPALAQRLIREGVGASLQGDLSRCRVKLPESFVLEVTYTNPIDAYRKAWYPGATQSGPQTVRFESSGLFRGAAGDPLHHVNGGPKVIRLSAKPELKEQSARVGRGPSP